MTFSYALAGSTLYSCNSDIQGNNILNRFGNNHAM